ncbi:MAG: BRO family protein, partial [Acidobacteriaceae bacterium]
MSNDSSKSRKLASIAFGDAFRNKSEQPDDKQDHAIEKLIADFEDASHVDEDGVQYWDARDLQKLLGYADWRNFTAVILKAKESCRNSDQKIENHFVDINEMVEVGSGAERSIETTRLTRYASYLVAQNGDSRKRMIAFAQTYFAIQARRQESHDDHADQYLPLSEDHRRLLLRDEIKEHNKHLASAAKRAGVRAPLDFAIF